MAPASPSSPTTSKTLTLGRSKRSVSVEPGDVGTADRAQLRNRRQRKNQKKRGRRHMSVEDVYPNEHANTSSSEEDHLARVSELKSFFENLDKAAANGRFCVFHHTCSSSSSLCREMCNKVFSAGSCTAGLKEKVHV